MIARAPMRVRLIRWARQEPLAAVMALYLVVVTFVAVVSGYVAPYDPAEQNIVNALAPPSSQHWLGTDDLGRDVLSRLLFGARLSLLAAVISVGAATLISVPMGLTAGYVGGRVDAVIMRYLDTQQALPGLVLIIAVAAALGGGVINTMLALSIAFVPPLTRIVRGETLAVRSEAFVDVSRAIGTPTLRIITQRILHNVAPPVLVQVAISCGLAMGAEAALSFIGLGAQPPDASWGSILRRSFDSIFITPEGVLFPAMAITLTAWAFNSVGDALGDQSALSGDARRGFHVHTAVAEGAATPGSSSDTLAVSQLTVNAEVSGSSVALVDDLSFSVDAGRILGIVGESGSGKTVTALSVCRLFPSPPGRIVSGSVQMVGHDVLDSGLEEMQQIRGGVVSMIFQNPRASLNPALPIGKQISETMVWHLGIGRQQAMVRAARLLRSVGVEPSWMSSYPHQLSGGMAQRVMIAIALACEPQVLIADEPTSALDVTVQAEILDLLRKAADDGMAVVMITHDLGVVADSCNDVLVMYAGEVVEFGPVEKVLGNPAHPYTQALQSAMPRPEGHSDELMAIPGQVPAPDEIGVGCRFASRCTFVEDECRESAISIDAWVSPDAAWRARCRRVMEVPTAVPEPAQRGR